MSSSRARDESSAFTLFAATWAMAALFHQLSFTDWRWSTVRGGVLTAAVIWALLKPSSWIRLATLLVIDVTVVGIGFPDQPNHIVFAWIVNLTLLTALGFAAARRDRNEPVETAWFRIFAPWVRIELVVLYFLTVFHKLNAAYLTLDSSCAAEMQRAITARLPIIPSGPAIGYAAIYGGLFAETAIPLLLLSRRTRVAGIFIGLLFHGWLALHPHPGIFSFSATMAALFTVFIPADMASSIRIPSWLTRIRPWALGAVAVISIVWFARSGLGLEARLDALWPRLPLVGLFVYAGYLCALLVGLALAVRARPASALGRLTGLWMATSVLLIFPLVILVNGLGPYAGLRTETALSMFSNLHTEGGGSNHLLVPAGWQVTTWQNDLVEIVNSNDAELVRLRDEGYRLPYLELRRRRDDSPDLVVTFRRNGETVTYDAARPDTAATLPPLGWFGRHYFFFRAVDVDPMHARCQH